MTNPRMTRRTADIDAHVETAIIVVAFCLSSFSLSSFNTAASATNVIDVVMSVSMRSMIGWCVDNDDDDDDDNDDDDEVSTI